MKRAMIITNCMPRTNFSSAITINKFLSLTTEVFDTVNVIGGNLQGMMDRKNVNFINVPCINSNSKISKFHKYISFQIRTFIVTLKHISRDDEVFFWIADKMVLSFLAIKLKRAKINFFVYGNIGFEGKRSFIRVFSKILILFMANHANYLCAESISVIKQWGVKKRKIRIIHLYIDKISNKNVRIGQRKNTVGMVCRLTEGKKVLESIVAFNEFHDKYPGWELEIIGSGKLYNDCVRKIDDLQANEYIKMFGWMEHKLLADIISTWRLLLFPTDTEGMPNSLIEAMAQHTPALVSPVGGICDIIRDGENGWFLSDCTVEEIKEGLQKVLMSNDYSEVAQAAYKTVVPKYLFSSAIENFKEQINIVK